MYAKCKKSVSIPAIGLFYSAFAACLVQVVSPLVLLNIFLFIQEIILHTTVTYTELKREYPQTSKMESFATVVISF